MNWENEGFVLELSWTKGKKIAQQIEKKEVVWKSL